MGKGVMKKCKCKHIFKIQAKKVSKGSRMKMTTGLSERWSAHKPVKKPKPAPRLPVFSRSRPRKWLDGKTVFWQEVKARANIPLYRPLLKASCEKLQDMTNGGRGRDPGRVQTNLQQKFHPRNNHLKVTCAKLTSSTSEHGRPLRSMQIPATPAHDANASHKNNNQKKKKTPQPCVN